jgi:hypothetical protein
LVVRRVWRQHATKIRSTCIAHCSRPPSCGMAINPFRLGSSSRLTSSRLARTLITGPGRFCRISSDSCRPFLYRFRTLILARQEFRLWCGCLIQPSFGAVPLPTVEETNLRVHIANLRKALGDGREGARYIATVPGRGYSVVAPVTLSTPQSSPRRDRRPSPIGSQGCHPS